MLKKLLYKFKTYYKEDLGFRIIVIGLICLLVFPWLFTRSFGLIEFNENSAWVGDAIGGVTGPISGFLGAILVYLALKQQINANELITKQFAEQKLISIVIEQLKILREDINNFKFSQNELKETTTQGTEAITMIMNMFGTNHDTAKEIDVSLLVKLNLLGSFLNAIDSLIDIVTKSPLPNDDKKNLTNLISESFSANLQIPLIPFRHKSSGRQRLCPECDIQHGIPDFIFEKYDIIIEKLYPGLIEQWNSKTASYAKIDNEKINP